MNWWRRERATTLAPFFFIYSLQGEPRKKHRAVPGYFLLQQASGRDWLLVCVYTNQGVYWAVFHVCVARCVRRVSPVHWPEAGLAVFLRLVQLVVSLSGPHR